MAHHERAVRMRHHARRPLPVLLLLASPLAAMADICTWPQTVILANQYFLATPTYEMVAGCFNAMPVNATTINNTLASMYSMLDLYSFTEVYAATGPPADVSVDLVGSLNAIAARTYTTDYAFHNDLSQLLASLHDGHTAYVKPDPYDVTAVLPFTLLPSLTSGALSFTMQPINVYGTDVMTVFAPAVRSYAGSRVIAVDGVSVINALTAFADGMIDGNDIGARIQAATVNAKFSVRSLQMVPLPPKRNITLTIVPANGVTTTLTVDWIMLAAPRVDIPTVIASSFARLPTVSCAVLAGGRRAEELDAATMRALRMRDVVAMRPAAVERAERPVWARHGDAAFLGNRVLVQGVEHAPGVRSLQSDPRVTIWDQQSSYGLRLQWDAGTSLLWLKISTFLPPAMNSCGGSYCSTPAQNNASGACTINVLKQFLSYAATQVFREYNARGAVGLVLDVTGNGGGSVALGQLYLLSLSQALYDNPFTALIQYDVRRSLALVGIYTALSAQPAVAWDPLIMSGSYLVGRNKTVSSMAQSNASWISSGTMRFRGNGSYPYSLPFVLYSTADLMPYVPARPPVRLDPSNLFIVSDGLCGSMCAQFLRVLQENRLARVLNIGGFPAAVSDTSSFVGGFVISDYNTVAIAVGQLRGSGLVLPPSLPFPKLLRSTGQISFNWGAALSFSSPPDYAQFRVYPPDAVMNVWGSVDTTLVIGPLRTALQQLVAAPYRQADGSLAGASAISSFSSPGGGTAATNNNNAVLGLAVVVGFLSLVVIILVLNLMCRPAATGAPAASKSDAPVRRSSITTATVAPATMPQQRVVAQNGSSHPQHHQPQAQVVAVSAATPASSHVSSRVGIDSVQPLMLSTSRGGPPGMRASSGFLVQDVTM